MKKKKKSNYIKIGDPNAKAMWGRTRSQTFKDKTKYNRKNKRFEEEDY